MGVYYIGSIPCSGGDIYHFGRKGMKWGERIFGELADRLERRGWTGASKAARGISTGFGRANEFINADDSRIRLNASNKLINESNKRLDEWNRYKRNDRYRGKQAGIMGDDRSYARSKFAQAIDDLAIGSEKRQRDRYTKARDEAQADYDKTLPGMMEKARAKVSKAYSDAAAALSGKGLDIQSFYSQVMEKAKGAINAGKDMVSKYGGQFVDQIKTMGENALKGGKKFLEGIMFKVKRSAAYAGHYINAEKKKKNREAPPGSLVWDDESQSWKPNDDTFVDKNHPEAEQHRKYIDDHGRVTTAETNTVVGHKKRMKDPGHLDPTREKAFARARKHWHMPYRTDKRMKEAERDRQMEEDDQYMIGYYAVNDPDYLPTYMDRIYIPNRKRREERARRREQERKSEYRY